MAPSRFNKWENDMPVFPYCGHMYPSSMSTCPSTGSWRVWKNLIQARNTQSNSLDRTLVHRGPQTHYGQFRESDSHNCMFGQHGGNWRPQRKLEQYLGKKCKFHIDTQSQARGSITQLWRSETLVLPTEQLPLPLRPSLEILGLRALRKNLNHG